MATLIESYNYQIAHKHETRQPLLIALNATLLVLSTVAVGLRLLARRLVKQRWSYDDYNMIFCLLLACGLSTTNLIAVHNGLGKHLFATGNLDATTKYRLQYVFTIIYSLCICFTKITILAFYYRLFPSEGFRRVVIAYVIALILVGGASNLVAIFPCTPIRAFWIRDIQRRCINVYRWAMTEAALTILTDILLLIMPMPLVWKLRISLRQKFAVSGIFILGGFVCIASIIRMPTLHLLFGYDPTWTAVPAAVWSLVEVNMGIVCACLPVMRPVARRIGQTGIFGNCARPRSSPARSSPWSSKSRSSAKSKWGNSTQATTVISVDEDERTFERLEDGSVREPAAVKSPQHSEAHELGSVSVAAPAGGFFVG
ncbi:MAG: hypothetical protein M1832_000939 [Thelocarpon impressellum]|nr:MAG: hypothetical protein M1832_000939 [Thelocarpon impressellum]